jgi:hypothetical protein
MDVPEYKQLPIPNWLELECPRCSYPLQGLPRHRCAECGFDFNIDLLMNDDVPRRPPELTPETRPVPELGLSCGTCGESLTGAMGHTCPACQAPFDLNDAIDRAKWSVLLVRPSQQEASALSLVLRNEGIPFRYGQQPLATIMGMNSIGRGGHLKVRRDYFLDALHLLATHLGNNSQNDAEWICPRCEEHVPAHFDICWNCNSTRP